jgi:CheY-like chemotaxis protein
VGATVHADPLTVPSPPSHTRPAEAPSVLVVDDHADAREMLTVFLSSCGFLVYTAADGLDAIATAVRVRPSVILMDLMMPRMDGCEATRRLKADPLTNAIPIIALSAHSQPAGTIMARAAGCDDVLRKPCDLDRLADQIRRRIDARRSSGATPLGD